MDNEERENSIVEQAPPAPKKDNSQLKKRIITGIFYVLVMAGILVLKILTPTYFSEQEYKEMVRFGDLGVDALFLAISAIGSYEYLRAVGDVSPVQKWVTIVTCSLMIPAFVISKITFGLCAPSWNNAEASLIIMLAVGSVGAMTVASCMVFDHEKSHLHSTACCEFCILYCGALVSVGSHINHMMTNSHVAILLLFVLVPFVDTAAFTFGKLFGKLLPYKLAPKTSPNKTIIGAVGGVIGGLLAAVLVWALGVYTEPIEFTYTRQLPSLVALMLISVPTSVLAQLGDLFESAIKRDCGVKDMGKLLPGHGGVLDRFDSMLFASVPILVLFMLIR